MEWKVEILFLEPVHNSLLLGGERTRGTYKIDVVCDSSKQGLHVVSASAALLAEITQHVEFAFLGDI